MSQKIEYKKDLFRFYKLTGDVACCVIAEKYPESLEHVAIYYTSKKSLLNISDLEESTKKEFNAAIKQASFYMLDVIEREVWL